MKSPTGPDQLVLVQTYEEAVRNEALEGKPVNSDPIPRMIARAFNDGFVAMTSANHPAWRSYVITVEPRETVGPR